MNQRFLALSFVVGLVVILVILNALTYVQKQEEGDSEFQPNRSSYNPAATGTQALYTLLLETGRKPTRWQETPESLTTSREKPDVFVMIGKFRRDVTEDESAAVLRWVAQGGRLVIIDRQPPKELCTSTANWKIEVTSEPAVELINIDPSDQNSMTLSTGAARPIQPTIFTTQINAVQPSRFAGWVSFERYSGAEAPSDHNTVSPHSRLLQDRSSSGLPTSVSPDSDVLDPPEAVYDERKTIGPIVHIAGNEKNLLVDVPYGSGSIVYLTDPYIVSNSGIAIVDNAQLALNVLATPGGTIAFDEYHQGYGSNANRLFQYFEGTPVIAIFAQCVLLVALLFASQSRRFARPMPEREPDRLSKLEYVTAMAELQQRSRAYDLAIENIYSDFRRRVSRMAGFDNTNATRAEIAHAIGERISIDASRIDEVMSKCESIIQGETTCPAETTQLAAKLREYADRLGIKRARIGRSEK
jgi:hypothetical protein